MPPLTFGERREAEPECSGCSEDVEPAVRAAASRRAATGSIARRSRFVMGSFVVLLRHGSPSLPHAVQTAPSKQPPGTCAEDARKA